MQIEPTVWGIHADRTGDAESLFTSTNVIALGWRELGDLASIVASREAFKAQYAQRIPDPKAAARSASVINIFPNRSNREEVGYQRLGGRRNTLYLQNQKECA